MCPRSSRAQNAQAPSGATKGEFKDGIFTWYDESGKKHNQDGLRGLL